MTEIKTQIIDSRDFSYQKGDVKLHFNLSFSKESKESVNDFLLLLAEAYVDVKELKHELE